MLSAGMKLRLKRQMCQPMTEVAIDSSAIIAILRGEPGAEDALPHVRGSHISTVNLAEVFYITDIHGAERVRVEQAIATMQLEESPFDREQAQIMAEIYPATLGSSVGFADRACMALALKLGIPCLTGDQDWQKHDVGIDVMLFREHKARDSRRA